MANTPLLDLPRLAESQASAEIVVNDAINRLDALVGLKVLSRADTSPPATAEGDAYLVATGGTGAWSGKDGMIAMYYGGWIFAPGKIGLIAYVQDENIFIGKKSGGWVTIV